MTQSNTESVQNHFFKLLLTAPKIVAKLGFMEVQWSSSNFNRSDLDRVLELRKAVFQDPLYDSNRWIWEYEKNPQGPYFIQLAIDKHDRSRLAGHYAILSYKLKAGDQIIQACQSLDTYTNSDYRNQGIFVGLANTVFEQAKADQVKVVFGFPNSSSFPGFSKKLGFASPFALYHYIKPLRLSYFSRRLPHHLRFNFLHHVRLFRKTTALPYTFRSVTQVPRDWEPLLNAFEKQFEILVHRDSAYMRWRYFECPDRTYHCFELRHSERLVGFAVLKLQDQTGQIVDLIVEDPKLWKKLITLSVIELHRMGAESAVAYLHSQNKLTPVFRSLKFIKRGLGSQFILRSLNPLPGSLNLSEPAHWYLMAGDTDYY